MLDEIHAAHASLFTARHVLMPLHNALTASVASVLLNSLGTCSCSTHRLHDGLAHN